MDISNHIVRELLDFLDHTDRTKVDHTTEIFTLLREIRREVYDFAIPMDDEDEDDLPDGVISPRTT